MIDEILKISKFIIDAFLHSWPYLIITIPLAVIINISGISRYINKTFNAKPLTAVLLATIVGAFSPFCSCGVIPIISALLISGVPVAPVMSFWLASPSMDPEIFFLSVSMLGLDLAVWRLAATFVMSLAGGYITHFLVLKNWLTSDVMKIDKSTKPIFSIRNSFKTIKGKMRPSPGFESVQSSGCGCNGEKTENNYFESANTGGVNTSVCSAPTAVSDDGYNPLLRKIVVESRKAVSMIIKFMAIAFFLEALIILYIPQEWIIRVLGSNNNFAIPVSSLTGIPLYTTNLTALGLMGGLLKQGMDSGAVLAFLIAGATTTVPAMAAVYGIVKKRVFILYVSFALGASLTTGYLYKLYNIFF